MHRLVFFLDDTMNLLLDDTLNLNRKLCLPQDRLLDDTLNEKALFIRVPEH